MRVTLLLADSAQVVGGKLYILGGGWSLTGPSVGPMALAVKVAVPWTAANEKHTFEISLHSEDGPLRVKSKGGGIEQAEVRFDGSFEVGRPPGLPRGTDIDAPLAIQVGPLPLVPDSGYEWRMTIDGHADDNWRLPFRVRPEN